MISILNLNLWSAPFTVEFFYKIFQMTQFHLVILEYLPPQDLHACDTGFNGASMQGHLARWLVTQERFFWIKWHNIVHSGLLDIESSFWRPFYANYFRDKIERLMSFKLSVSLKWLYRWYIFFLESYLMFDITC